MALYKFVFSPTGRTAMVAAAIGKRLGVDPVEVDLSARDCDVSELELGPADVCVVAVPCFAGRVPAVAAQRLVGLQGNRARAVAVVSYGNRAFDDALVELQDLLEARGLRCVAAVAAVCEHSMFRAFAEGRPGEDDVHELKGFSLQIGKMLMGDDGTIVLGELPGKRPYREPASPLRPHADENCTRCGSCAGPCPVGAIPASDPMQTDEEACIGCMRCVAICPHGVRKLSLLASTQAFRKLRTACAVPKPNQLWLGSRAARGSEER